ncbi:MAG: hypothetical protein LBR44_02310 [Clostridiales Family XIII bacterium]|nr:hypothetical protein [Clostridiales Family XIII bacterium]
MGAEFHLITERRIDLSHPLLLAAGYERGEGAVLVISMVEKSDKFGYLHPMLSGSGIVVIE